MINRTFTHCRFNAILPFCQYIHNCDVNYICFTKQKRWLWYLRFSLTVLSADCSGGSDLSLSSEERVPMRRSSTREQDHRSGGTCFLFAASDYSCSADGGRGKTGNCLCKFNCFSISIIWTLILCLQDYNYCFSCLSVFVDTSLCVCYWCLIHLEFN